MTKEEFLERYDFLMEKIPSNIEVVKCDCGTDYCPGWKLDIKDDKEDVSH
jgi:hypothetical protein